MNVLVTGGCGYVGGTLVPQLLDDDRVGTVRILDSPEPGSPRNPVGTGLGTDPCLEFQRGDVREYGHVENAVFASSCNSYGRAASTDIDETTEPDPLNPYAETKHQSEQLLAEAVAEYGFDATTRRTRETR